MAEPDHFTPLLLTAAEREGLLQFLLDCGIEVAGAADAKPPLAARTAAPLVSRRAPGNDESSEGAQA